MPHARVTADAKGAAEFRRTYGPIGPDGAAAGENASPSTGKMPGEIGANLAVVRSYPSLAGVPVLVGECDPGCRPTWASSAPGTTCSGTR